MKPTLRHLAWVLAVSALGTTGAARGQGAGQAPVVGPDRPDLADGIQIVPLGHWQVEGGTTLLRSGDTDVLTLGEVMLRIPWSERLESRLQVLNVAVASGAEHGHGILDPSVDLKWKLFDSSSTDFGLVLGSSLPLGEKNYRSPHLQPYATLALDRVLSDRVSLTVNLGGASVSADDETLRVLSGGVSVAIQATSRLTGFVEGFGWNRTEPGGPGEQVLDGGLQFLVNDRLMVDARLGFAFGRTAPDGFAGFGLALLF